MSLLTFYLYHLFLSDDFPDIGNMRKWLRKSNFELRQGLPSEALFQHLANLYSNIKTKHQITGTNY